LVLYGDACGGPCRYSLAVIVSERKGHTLAFSNSSLLEAAPEPRTPDAGQAANRCGISRYQAGDFAGAIAEYDRALRSRPDLAEAYNNRGAARFALGDFAGALADYSAALLFCAAYPEALNNRGAVRHVIGDFAGAVADYDAAIRLNPGYTEAYDNRAAAHSCLWNFPGAVADYDRAIEQYRNGPRAQTRLCMLHVYRANNRYHCYDLPGAIADLHAAADLNPELYVQTMLHVVEREATECLGYALSACDRHLEREPRDFITYARRGVLMLRLCRKAEAWLDLEAGARCGTPRDLVLAQRLIDRLGDDADRERAEATVAQAWRRTAAGG
jgi:tetratricopeptide (TPR) repeat protein